jgi:hypothetical protein
VHPQRQLLVVPVGLVLSRRPADYFPGDHIQYLRKNRLSGEFFYLLELALVFVVEVKLSQNRRFFGTASLMHLF